MGRKRKIASNPPPTGKRRSHSTTGNELKNIQPYQRVKEFTGEHLKVIHKKLFCEACREGLSLKSSSLRNHFRSTKHVEGKKRIARKEARERDIAEAFKVYNADNNLKGETVPESQQVYQVKVVTCFLRAGVPLSKFSCFRELLEESAFRTSDRRHMLDLIPFVIQQEQAEIKKEANGKCVSVVFDRTTRMGEALAVMLRFIDKEEWVIKQRLVHVQLLAKSLCGEEIARELISILSMVLSRKIF